jgi:hypothetical protein
VSPGSSAARQASGFRPPGARSWALVMPAAQKRDAPLRWRWNSGNVGRDHAQARVRLCSNPKRGTLHSWINHPR